MSITIRLKNNQLPNQYRPMLGKKIIIDKEECDDCELYVNACHEGAICLIDGKAELVNANLCDADTLPGLEILCG